MNDPRSDEYKHPDGNEDAGITNLDECKAWVKEKYPMRGHKTGEMIRSLVTEVELLRLACSQLEAKVYQTAPGQLEFAPDGWTWQQAYKQQAATNSDLVAECEDQSKRYAKLLGACRKLQSAWAPMHIVNSPLDLAVVEVILATSDIYARADAQ